MGYAAKDILSLAEKEKGYFEKRSLSDLDDKTANAGSGNFTKYARDLYKAGYYNGNKQGVAWCSMFVDWCHYMAAGNDKALAQRITCQSGIYGASCTYSMNYYKSAGRFFKDPQPGDQVFFGTGKSAEHTGIVKEIKNGRVYTIEGNTSSQSGVVSNGGGVFEKSYPLTHSKILGYGRPLYDDETVTVDPEPEEEKSSLKLPDFTVGMQILRKGDAGDAVRALQILLIGNKCTCGSWGADGNFGAATEMAVRNYQKKNHLQVDGAAGPETWRSLLGI